MLHCLRRRQASKTDRQIRIGRLAYSRCSKYKGVTMARSSVGVLVLATWVLLVALFRCRGYALRRDSPRCGYQSCPTGVPTKLNVHVICHTHLDAGWVKTMDDYYRRSVKLILDSVTRELYEDPERKFIMVESAFFSRWWNEQDARSKRRVQRLVETGQLEFISGGWSMNDEATAHYVAIIDQMTLGLRWLNSTFGPQCGVPKVGWQIDPFGHSKEFASLLAQMGFDGLFLGRIDYQDKENRENNRTMEFVWKASPNLAAKGDIFTGILPNVYWPPTGFCFDTHCWDEEITEGNQVSKATALIEEARRQAVHYATNHIVMTMGMDFYYRDAAKWYRNLGRLITQVNALQRKGSSVNIFYSTPSCYLRALHETNRTWPIKDDDFFPYADAAHAYWTGYYTSRPALKYHIRHANAFLQACKQLVTLSRAEDAPFDKLQRALGILQHHDAVTGTAKQFVVEDYTFMLDEGIKECQGSINNAYIRLLSTDGFVPEEQIFCDRLNVSQCVVTETEDKILITAYNPRGQPVDTHIRVPVRYGSYSVRDAMGALVQKQLVPIADGVKLIPERTTPIGHELVFAANLPALGFTTFHVETRNDYSPVDDEMAHVYSSASEDVFIGNENIRVVVDGLTGLMREVMLKDGQVIPIHQSFFYYEGQPGYMFEKASGAYAFNPFFDQPRHLGNNVTMKVVKGNLVEEVHQTFNSWVSQVIRVYKDSDFVEFDWVIGPIPVREDYIGKEVISRFDSFLISNATFYTDSNGREIIKRERNYRQTWNLDVHEQVAGNYYPVASTIFIRDTNRNLQMTILTDRSEGGSSIIDGSIELMVHRRLLFDDGYGMDEALDELGVDGRGLVVRGRHALLITNIQESAKRWKQVSRDLFWKPVLTFRPLSPDNQLESFRAQLLRSRYTGLKATLPENINILTLEPICERGDRILLRLEHCFEVNEDPELSAPTAVSLRELFKPFKITSVNETTLSANRYAQDVDRLYFRSELPYRNEYVTHLSGYIPSSERQEAPSSQDNDLVVVLKAMEIKTFIITVEGRGDCAPLHF